MLDSFNTSSCTHPVSQDPPCRECAQKYITQKAGSEDWTKIRCVGYQCRGVFHHRDMQIYASKDDQAGYEVILSKRAVETEYVDCAHKGCKSRGICDPDKHSFFVCLTCKGRTCFTCYKKWHLGKTCGQQQAEEDASSPEAVVAARAARKAEEEASARVVKDTARPCPNPNTICQY